MKVGGVSYILSCLFLAFFFIYISSSLIRSHLSALLLLICFSFLFLSRVEGDVTIES